VIATTLLIGLALPAGKGVPHLEGVDLELDELVPA